MIHDLVQLRSIAPITKRMFKVLFLLLAVLQVSMPAVRAESKSDSCCGYAVNTGKHIQLSMPDPTRLLPSDLEITKQLMQRNSELRSIPYFPSVTEADDQIHLQFMLDSLNTNWKNDSAHSDLWIDESFRLWTLSFSGDTDSADIQIHDQFQKDLM